MSEERERRAGLNEAIFRHLNEEVRDLNEAFDAHDGMMTIVCECADAGCAERLALPVSEYERVRSDSLLYVIASGHVFPEVDRLVERHGSWGVVRKVGIAGEIAEETDPRS